MIFAGMSLQGSNLTGECPAVLVEGCDVDAEPGVDAIPEPEIVLEHPANTSARTETAASRDIFGLATVMPITAGVVRVHRRVPAAQGDKQGFHFLNLSHM